MRKESKDLEKAIQAIEEASGLCNSDRYKVEEEWDMKYRGLKQGDRAVMKLCKEQREYNWLNQAAMQ